MQSSLLPENQQWLIDRCNALGMEASKTGVCKGYGHMAMQAYLAEDVNTFIRRQEIMNSVPVEKFKDYYDALKEKRTDFIADIKKKANILFQELNEEEIQKFENTPSIISELEKIKQFVMESDKTSIAKEKDFAKRKKDWIQNTFVQNKIDEALNKLPDDERIAFDIPIFFEGIERYHHHFSSLEALGKSGNKRQELESAIALLTPDKLEKEGGIMIIDSFSGIYNESNPVLSELEKYFDEVSRVGRKVDNRFVLGFTSSNHFICIGCENFLSLRFQFFDANKPELARSVFNRDAIFKLVLPAFSKSGITTFQTRIYFTRKNEDELLQFEKDFKSSFWWKKQHAITPEKAKLTDSNGASWLHVASHLGEDKTVEELLKQGADPNLIDYDKGNTPLHDACLGGDLQTVKILLKYKAYPNIENFSGSTPLSLAVGSGFNEIANELLRNNADPDLFSDTLCCCILNEDIEMLKLLLENKANPDIKFINNSYPLHIAVLTGNLAMVEELLKYNANPDRLNANQQTPLYLACMEGSLPIMKKLFEANANTDLSKIPILIQPCIFGDEKIVSELLSTQKFNPDAVGDGHSALYFAAEKGNFKVCELLLKHGANPNLATSPPSPLFIAAQNGYADIVSLLLEHPLTNSTTGLSIDIESLRKFSTTMHVEKAVEDFLKIKKIDESSGKLIILPDEIAEIMGHFDIATLIRNQTPSTVASEICKYIDDKIDFDKINADEKSAWTAFKTMLRDADNDNETVYDIFKKWKDIKSENGKTYLEILVPKQDKPGYLFSHKNENNINADTINNILMENNKEIPQQTRMVSNLRKTT